MNRDLDIFARFVKKYKVVSLICLIVALLFLLQVFLAIRVVLINNDNQISKESGSSSATAKIKSENGGEDSHTNDIAFQEHKSEDRALPVDGRRVPVRIFLKYL